MTKNRRFITVIIDEEYITCIIAIVQGACPDDSLIHNVGKWYSTNMMKKLRVWVFIFPILHVLFIGTMISWHIQDIDFFGHISDRLSLRGSLQVTRGEQGISQLDVQYEGLNFPFFSRSSIQVVGPAQDIRRLRVTGYNTLDDGFTVLFQEGFQIQFITQGDRELRIIPSIPETLQPVAEIIIPVNLIDGSQVEQTDNLAVLSIDTGSDVFLLTLPPRAVLNADRGTLTLPGNVGRQTIRYVRTERIASSEQETVEETALPWYESEEIRVSEESYTADVGSYIDTAYTGWRTTRFDAGTSTWRRPNDSPQFNEQALISYLAESWSRNDYTAAFNSMRTAADRHPDAVSYRSSVFLGNLRENRAAMEEQDQQRVSRLSAAIESGDTRPLHDPGLVEWVILRGSEELLEQLPAYISDIQLESLETAGLVGLLENSLYDEAMPQELRETLASRQQPIVAMLLDQLFRNSNQIYLEGSPGQIDGELSLRAGISLTQIGSRQDDHQLTGIGRTMVQSILREADSLGFLPALLLTNDDEIIEREGLIAPEDIYRYIHSNDAYPQAISLYDELGQGSFIYSVVEFSSVRNQNNSLTLQLAGPRLRTHYIYIHGLPQYQSLNLFGYQWPADPSFENYSRGTFYHQASNTAMIKFFEDSTSSEIIYRF